eukprot:gnl/TRDRNA2_/TRDRNA2_166844_c0_seq1.p1 gnl/TRDRNA2_/TRDRNA2_166844_c0~~gnl/TRDRNA2_/TRDRNA2_166844_c0_seq1.p1  ORF type:complete len:433 (+),score=26.25 gnl/TRDRNA2_/TRDRNA2_166844_c0_seq1:50-1348(+)
MRLDRQPPSHLQAVVSGRPCSRERASSRGWSPKVWRPHQPLSAPAVSREGAASRAEFYASRRRPRSPSCDGQQLRSGSPGSKFDRSTSTVASSPVSAPCTPAKSLTFGQNGWYSPSTAEASTHVSSPGRECNLSMADTAVSPASCTPETDLAADVPHSKPEARTPSSVHPVGKPIRVRSASCERLRSHGWHRGRGPPASCLTFAEKVWAYENYASSWGAAGRCSPMRFASQRRSLDELDYFATRARVRSASPSLGLAHRSSIGSLSTSHQTLGEQVWAYENYGSSWGTAGRRSYMSFTPRASSADLSYSITSFSPRSSTSDVVQRRSPVQHQSSESFSCIPCAEVAPASQQTRRNRAREWPATRYPGYAASAAPETLALLRNRQSRYSAWRPREEASCRRRSFSPHTLSALQRHRPRRDKAIERILTNVLAM